MRVDADDTVLLASIAAAGPFFLRMLSEDEGVSPARVHLRRLNKVAVHDRRPVAPRGGAAGGQRVRAAVKATLRPDTCGRQQRRCGGALVNIFRSHC